MAVTCTAAVSHWIFSANTNPLGTPPAFWMRCAGLCPGCTATPTPYCRRLVQAIATHEQVPASYVLCGNGAADLIYAYCAALRPRTAVEPAPTFAEYGLGLAQVGCRVTPYFLHQAENFDVDEGFLPFWKRKSRRRYSSAPPTTPPDGCCRCRCWSGSCKAVRRGVRGCFWMSASSTLRRTVSAPKPFWRRTRSC